VETLNQIKRLDYVLSKSLFSEQSDTKVSLTIRNLAFRYLKSLNYLELARKKLKTGF
tara:strand:- start:342 stop:512 length:171 start_codon:yes stop_codon:yes gene_type:complete